MVIEKEAGNCMWLRVFGTGEKQPEPAALLEHLHGLGFEVTGHFKGDDQGWFEAELVGGSGAEPMRLQRYLATEEGIRDELNAWAAWLEVGDHVALMQHMISTKQLFTLQRPADGFEPLCLAACRFLARETDGIYQVDSEGFFAAGGTLLVREE